MPQLAISSAVLALLHFNMVQTLFALICSIVLGLIYLRIGSVVCCITAHAGYNMISYCPRCKCVSKKLYNLIRSGLPSQAQVEWITKK